MVILKYYDKVKIQGHIWPKVNLFLCYLSTNLNVLHVKQILLPFTEFEKLENKSIV